MRRPLRFLAASCLLVPYLAPAPAHGQETTAVPAYAITEKAPLTRQGCTVMEDDPQAKGGKALRMAPEKKQANVVSDYYFYPAYPGRYRFTWRLKIDDNKGESAVVQMTPQFPAAKPSFNPTLTLKPKDWKAAGAYEDFAIEGTVPEHDYGVFSTYFDPAPNRSVWWDTSTFTLLERYDDERIAKELYPDFKLPATMARTAGEPGKPRVQVIYHGPTYAVSGVRGALAALGLPAPPPEELPANMATYKPVPPRAGDGWRETAWIDHGQSRLPAPGFPETPEAFSGLDIIVLANVSPRALKAPSRLLLRQWVKQAGGTLLLTGGMNSFGKGFAAGTAIEEMLPVELAGLNDLKPAKDGRLVFKDEALKALAGTEVLGTKFLQGLKAKPAARVLIESGDGAPLLVEGRYGAGRVLCWLGAPLGSTPAGQTAWWKSAQWPAILGAALK